MVSSRQEHLDRFYVLLADLEQRLGGRRRLAEARGGLSWPRRGVYFVFEPGELREDGRSSRVVRVGTHGLKSGATSTLWTRLHQHRGSQKGGLLGGNHRGSVFRLHVGEALVAHGDEPAVPTWAQAASASREPEGPLEAAVSAVIGGMDVIWVEVDDLPGPSSQRGWIESNAIGLLSNRAQTAIDPPSAGWLGRHARAQRIRESGLWNVNHVDEGYDPAFLDALDQLVGDLREPGTRRHPGTAAEEHGP